MKISPSIFLLLLLEIFVSVIGYPNGAPDSACGEMIPRHQSTTSQTSSFPYTLSLDKVEVKPGDKVQITINGNINGIKFKGYLLQGRKASGGVTPVGTFDAGPETKLVKCTYTSSTITHSQPKNKESITVTWVAPQEKGTYRIMATVVQEFVKFWVKHPSENIEVV